MYLKSIEVHGFKSFANKINFEFHNGITCIVGPNGSGKSNVADAVRWVLGEQSAKQLRGSNMQDVIFSGTENRKPQGFAHVSITLDNSDHELNIGYQEVTVARRVYRSGESEYLLNGHACRLKDVNELFYDTGIGKEGYSIIGQGQIEQILSSKPEDRRELFDEAAGIVKFKRRKSIALKKLESEQANKIRVYDILSELEKQVGPLEKQSETARQFLKLKEELKLYDIHVYILDQEAITKNLESLEEKIHIAGDDLEENTKKSDRLKSQYEAVEIQMEQLDRILEEKRDTQSRIDIELGNLQGKMNVLHEQINTERMKEEHIANRIQTICQELKDKGTQKEKIGQEQLEINRKLYDCANARDRARLEMEGLDKKIDGYRQTLEQNKGRIIERLNEKSSYMAKQQRVKTMLEQNQIRKAELNQKLSRSKTEEEAQRKIEEDCQRRREHLKEQDRQLEVQKQELEQAVAELEQESCKLAELLSENQKKYQTAHTRAESLKDLAERYEGYGTSIKRLMEQKKRVPGIHGVVADIIKAEKKYEIALETALGGSIQNVVTDTEQTAKELIEFLKKNRFGRATFLPLDGIRVRGSFQQKEVLKEPGVIGLASDLVSVSDEYQTLISYLLGRILVVDKIDRALAIAQKYQHSVRIVTLEGELLNPGGSMTGGAFKNTSNLLGRGREIRELETEAKIRCGRIEELEKKRMQAQEKLAQGRQQFSQAHNDQQKIALDETSLRINQEQAKAKSEEIAGKRSDVLTEVRQLEQQITHIKAECMKLEATITQIDEDNSRSESSADEYHDALEKELISREEKAKQTEEFGLEYANLSQSHKYLLENTDRISQEMDKLSEEEKELENDTKAGRGAIEEKQSSIQSMEQQTAQMQKQAECLREEFRNLSHKKESVMQKQRGFFEQKDEISFRISALDKELFRLNDQKEKQEERLDAQTGYLWNEYGLSPSEAMEQKREEFDNLNQMRRHINELKGEIRGLGNVNVNAIESYREVLERYTFMKSQYDDLTIAETALVKVIDDLDRGMRRQFEEKFGQIKIEFNKVFRELFGGGQGTLELMEGEDVIEAGIRIISQPPGKKLQNMMQLSGGEKALTAISLLFAIQNLKPSPFCLLDEIEAALDDSNVGRFSNYLHKLTKSTQFIIITHRRGTMASADRLYGITMQEKGVSALVSVNLIQEQLT